jgi:hypothetical protein
VSPGKRGRERMAIHWATEQRKGWRKIEEEDGRAAGERDFYRC